MSTGLDGLTPEYLHQIGYQRSRGELLRQGAQSGLFAPGTPPAPIDGVGGVPVSWNFPTGYNLRTRAEREGRISFETMKQITDNYEIARICIQHRLDDVRSLNWQIVPEIGYTPSEVREDMAIARDIILSPDGVHDFGSWIHMLGEDVLRYDAGTLHRRFNRGGNVCGLEVVSGPTIAPVLDPWGRRPTGDAPAFVQFRNGTAWKWFPARQFIYQPFRPQPDSAYGWAPIESVLLSANTTLRIQTHWMNYFTEGNMPAGFATLPEDVKSPDQLDAWQEKYTAQYAGDDAAKHQMRFLPHGAELFWPKDGKFDPEQAEFLMRVTCAAFSVVPNDLGFTEDVNRSTGDTQVDVQFRVGTLPLLRYFENILSSHLRHDRGLRVRFVFDTGQEAEERRQMADVWDKAVHNGAASSSEYRTNVLSLEADEEPIPRGVITANGIFMPIDAMRQAAGGDGEDAHVIFPASVQSASAPAPGQTGTPDRPEPAASAMQKRNVPQSERDDMDSSDFAGPHQSFPIAKPEDVAAAAHSLGRAKGDRAAIKSRIISIAHRKGAAYVAQLPDAWKMSKSMEAAGRYTLDDLHQAAISCAGLCLIAGDTGRVLMIQRALEEGDPAGGTWEFPGGHLEPGETPLQGAVREWQEETGCLLPAGLDFFPVQDNGIYRLHAAVVAREDLVPVNTARCVNNPDDPDGDCIEACAWWVPQDAAANPALRPELAEAPWDTIADLSAGSMEGVAKTLSKWRSVSLKRIAAGKAPYKFADSGLPVSVETRVWKALRTADTPELVTQAFKI